MHVMEGYELFEILEPEILTNMPNEKFDSFAIYNLTYDQGLPPDHPDYFVCKLKTIYLNKISECPKFFIFLSNKYQIVSIMNLLIYSCH